VARRKLRQLEIAERLDDLRVPPDNRLEALKGDRAGRRSVTADTDLSLCRFFGLSNGCWLRTQAAHDTEVAARALGAKLLKIEPWPGTSAQDHRVLSRA
jgi:plasmid maintenance system killer protein